MSVGPLLDQLTQLFLQFARALPALLFALVLVTAFFAAGTLLRRVVRHFHDRHPEGRTLGLVLGRVTQWLFVLVGLLTAATVIFPSFRPRDLITFLGIGSVAIGFAFKDIFENFLAGILILLTKPFRIGDQIVVEGYEGTVEQIQTRATFITTYDGRRIVIPNAKLYTNPVTVNTAFARRRMQYDVPIGYGDDINRARGIVLEVLEQAEDVLPDPKADVIVVELADSSVKLRARYWCRSQIADVLLAQDRVLTAIKERLTAGGIDIPFPTTQVLFHDQTEEVDGLRGQQREGWPAPADSQPPAPRRIQSP